MDDHDYISNHVKFLHDISPEIAKAMNEHLVPVLNYDRQTGEASTFQFLDKVDTKTIAYTWANAEEHPRQHLGILFF